MKKRKENNLLLGPELKNVITFTIVCNGCSCGCESLRILDLIVTPVLYRYYLADKAVAPFRWSQSVR